MDFPVLLHDQFAAAPVRQTDAYAGVLHGAGDTHGIARRHRFIISGLDGLQCLHETGGIVDDLAVGQHPAGAYGIAVTDLPG